MASFKHRLKASVGGAPTQQIQRAYIQRIASPTQDRLAVILTGEYDRWRQSFGPGDERWLNRMPCAQLVIFWSMWKEPETE